MPWTVYSRREATSAAAKALIASPQLSDAALAELAHCGSTTIGTVRAKLEQIGVIERVEPSDRAARPRPRQPSPARDAIEQLGEAATPRAVAELAGVSYAAAWKAWRKLNPPLHDAAAAVDAISVVRDTPQLTDAAGSTDQLTVVVTITCECGTQFRVSTADAQRRHNRFCSDPCRNADSRAHNRQPRPRHADRTRYQHLPQIPDYPPMPEEIRLGGLCVQPGLKPEHRFVWTSDDPEEREIAKRYCRACSVRQVCFGWSLSRPVTDPAIYAGQSQAQRLKAKRDRQAAIRASK